MLKIIKYKIILFTLTATALTICTLITCLGFLDIYIHVAPQIRADSPAVRGAHKIVVLSIFVFSNISIALHICYMSVQALRGLRTTWFIGCHYFLYIVGELISACVVFAEFRRLKYNSTLAALVAVLAVCLFGITFAAEKIFEEVEDTVGRRQRELRFRASRRGGKSVRVPLHGPGFFGNKCSLI